MARKTVKTTRMDLIGWGTESHSSRAGQVEDGQNVGKLKLKLKIAAWSWGFEGSRESDRKEKFLVGERCMNWCKISAWSNLRDLIHNHYFHA